MREFQALHIRNGQSGEAGEEEHLPGLFSFPVVHFQRHELGHIALLRDQNLITEK